MELKVVCNCGQKYKFDVEPVNRQMPFKVACPVCGLDGTGLANNLLMQMPAPAAMPPPIPVAQLVSVGAVAAPVAMAVPVAMAAPVAVAAAPVATAAPAAPATGGLRINKQHAPAATPPPVVAAAVAAAPAGRPAATAAMAPQAMPKYMKDNAAIQNNSFILGVVGAFLGAAVGVGLLYGFYALTDVKMPLIGTVSGALTGFGARLLYRGTSSTLGAMSAAVAFVCIGVTLFLLFGILGMMFSVISLFVAVSLAFKIASG